MTPPSPFADPESWDTLVLGGVRFRGTFKWSGDLIKREIDQRHAAGRDGAKLRDKGYVAAEVDLILTMTTDDEWREMCALVALVFPRGAAPSARNAHPCAHPQLALAGISELYGASLGPVTEAGATKYEVVLKLLEYRPGAQTNTSRTPRAVPPAPGLGGNATAFDAGIEHALPTPPPAPGPNR